MPLPLLTLRVTRPSVSHLASQRGAPPPLVCDLSFRGSELCFATFALAMISYLAGIAGADLTAAWARLSADPEERGLGAKTDTSPPLTRRPHRRRRARREPTRR